MPTPEDVIACWQLFDNMCECTSAAATALPLNCYLKPLAQSQPSILGVLSALLKVPSLHV
jgi:hypothetical protein